MKQKIRLGVVCLARKTFDYQAAHEIYKSKQIILAQIEQVEWITCDDLVIEVEEAQEAAEKLAAHLVDGVVIISGTFHLGHLALMIDKVVRKPILLWALDELPYNGGKIRLNSACGMNLNASNLYKSGNNEYWSVMGDAIDENWIDAIRIKVAINQAKIGILGFHAHGFFNLDVDELKLFKDLGVLADQYPLSSIWSEPVSDEELARSTDEIKSIFDLSTLSLKQIDKTARLAASAKAFMDKNRLTAAAIRCWPEFASQYGVSPCAAMSILQSQGYILGCEGDLEGTLTMVAARAIGAETPFLADLSQVDLKQDTALMWHCGVAPCNLWDQSCVRSLDTYFAGGKGVTADFVLKQGQVNVFRLDSARGKTRVYMAAGEALPMDKLLRGTYAKVRFEQTIQELLNQIIYTGVAHHLIMVYGEYRRAFEIFARIMGLEVIGLATKH